MKYLKFVISALLLAMSISASATTLDFNAVSESYYMSSYSEAGYNFTPTDDMGSLSSSVPGTYWTGNGTGRLLTWTNSTSETSGFTLSNTSGSFFSLNSFDFGNGYVSGLNPVTSLTLTGVFGGGATITEIFSNTTSAWSYISLSSLWQNLESVSFLAHGAGNRAVWDNIVLNEVSTVPVPAAAWLFGSALLGFFGFSRRKAKS